MSNHTPGPWERRKRMVPIIDQEGFTWDGDYVIWQGDVPLAEVNCCDGIGEQQAGHNASLIAAAPEMLRLLKIVEPLIDEICMSYEPINSIKAVIAKTEGEKE